MSIFGTIGAVASGLGAVANPFVQNYFNNKNQKSARRAEKRNMAFQTEFAKHGLRWKVEDARRAGINPLTALGAQTNSPMPMAVGRNDPAPDLSRMGQDISKAIQGSMTREEREIHQLNKRLLEVKIDGQEIDNNNSRLTGRSGSFPPEGYSGSNAEVGYNGTKMVPAEITQAKQRGVEAGVKAFNQDTIDDKGYLTRVPSKEMSELVESHFPTWIRENIKSANQAVKSWISAVSPKQKEIYAHELRQIRPKAPSGYEYRWDNLKVAWKISKLGKDNRSYLFVRPMKTNKKYFKVR